MSPKMKITEVREKNEGSLNPAVVIFQNGELLKHKLSDLKVKLSPSEKNQMNVEVTTPDGHLFVSDNSNRLPYKNILAIRNKKTNKVRLVEVDYSFLVNSVLSKTEEVIKVPEDYGAQTLALQRMFGGKKAVRRLEQKEKLNIDTSFMEDKLKAFAAVVDVSQEMLSASNVEVDSMNVILPPCHRDARNASEVYLLTEIFSQEELLSAEEEVKNIIDDENYAHKRYSSFFISALRLAKQSEMNLNQRIAGLIFVDALIAFVTMMAKKLKNKTINLCEVSNDFHIKIINEFCVTTETSINRPLTMRDKALCYIIAISLVCCDNSVDLELLSKATSFNLTKLAQLAKVVGAVPTIKDSHVYIMRIPLPPLPKLSKGKKTNRR